jgi:predicted thioesterase
VTYEAIQVGLRGQVDLTVEDAHTAGRLGSGSVRVLATPEMVLLMERAGVAAVDHLLPEGLATVGVHLDVRHLEPTPVGMGVRATAELVQVEGRRLTFRVEVREEPFGAQQLVGSGSHQRAIIDVEEFHQRVVQKAASGSSQ